MHHFILAILALWLSGCAPASTTTPASVVDTGMAAIPFKLVGNRVVVPVTVNGHGPFDFMLDTGASGVGRLDDSLARALGIPTAGQVENFDGVNTSAVDVVVVEHLTLGSFTQRDVQLLSRAYREYGIQGILGQGYFEERLLTIDYSNQVVRIASGSLDPDDRHVVAYDRPFEIPVRLGQLDTIGNLDTGSSLAMHLPLAYANRLKTTQLVEAGRGRRANTEFQLYRATILEPIVLADNTMTAVEVLFSEKAQSINIGSTLLQHFALTLDQQNRRIRIAPPSEVN